MDKDGVFQMIKVCLQDIKKGAITEKEVAETLKEEGFDWNELKTTYNNLLKLTKVIKDGLRAE